MQAVWFNALSLAGLCRGGQALFKYMVLCLRVSQEQRESEPRLDMD